MKLEKKSLQVILWGEKLTLQERTAAEVFEYSEFAQSYDNLPPAEMLQRAIFAASNAVSSALRINVKQLPPKWKILKRREVKRFNYRLTTEGIMKELTYSIIFRLFDKLTQLELGEEYKEVDLKEDSKKKFPERSDRG